MENYSASSISDLERLLEGMQATKVVIVAVGLPGAGKSTLASHCKGPHFCWINWDAVASDVTARCGVDREALFECPPDGSFVGQIVKGKECYGPVVENTYPKGRPLIYSFSLSLNWEVEHRCQNDIRAALLNDGIKTIFIDRCHLRRWQRAQYELALSIPSLNVRRVAIVFPLTNIDLYSDRVESRWKDGDESGVKRCISREKILQFEKLFEEIDATENFDRVIHYSGNVGREV